MALESKAYRDPLQYLIQRESKTCAGCDHKKYLVLMGKRYELCSLGNTYGVRCRKYREAK